MQDLNPKGLDAEAKALLAFQAAFDRKARDILVLDLRKLAAITDLFLICSGENARQMQAIMDSIDERLSGNGVEPLFREGANEENWILMDYDDLVVHIFNPKSRQFYNLERLWSRAPQLTQLAGETLQGPESEGDRIPKPIRTGNPR